MNEPTPKNLPQQSVQHRAKPLGIDLKMAYTILWKAYLRNHPNVFQDKNLIQEQYHE